MTPEEFNYFTAQAREPKILAQIRNRISCWVNFGGGIDDTLMYPLKRIVKKGLWQDEIGEAIAEMIEIGNGKSGLYAQRLIENCTPYLENPNFSFPQYHKLFGRALRHFGLRAGSYFGRSYGRLFELGVDPEEYYQLVDKAAETGKLFAAWYAYSLPGVVEAEGKPNVFLAHAERICKWHGFIPLGKSFLLATAEMLRSGVSIPDFSLQTSKATDIFGKKPASWLVRAMANSAIINYPHQELIEDAQEILKIKGPDKGPSAVGWFASGLMGIEASKKRIREVIARLEERLKPGVEDRSRIEGSIKFYREIERIFDSNHFESSYKKGFLKLLELKSLSAVTFYSLCVGANRFSLDIERISLDAEQVKTFLELPDRVISFRDQVSRTVFSKAMWFVPKISYGWSSIVELLQEIERSVKEKGDELTINAIKYTWGVKKRGESSSRLWFPSSKKETGEGYSDLDWEEYNESQGYQREEEETFPLASNENDEIPF